MRVPYRLRQGLRDLLAFRRPVELTRAASVLTPAQMALFRRMTRAEQLHSLGVLASVTRQEADTPHDLQVAALLHDVGKSRCPLNVAERSVAVLVHRLLPAADAHLSRHERLDWLHAPFVVRRHHPRWGADMLRMTGGSERAVWLVEHHADALPRWRDHPYAPLLRRLRAADDEN